MRNNQFSNKENYIQSLFAPEDTELAKVFETLHIDESHMQISAIEGKILCTLATMVGAKKIVEIGSLAGYSAIWMARALPALGKLYTIEADNNKQPRILKNIAACGVAEKIELIIGKASEKLPGISKHGPFDMVFIDADKGAYLNYLDWAEANIRKGGLVIGDNTFLFGAVYGETQRELPEQTIDIMKKFNERLANPEKYTSIILPTIEGMTVAVKNF